MGYFDYRTMRLAAACLKSAGANPLVPAFVVLLFIIGGCASTEPPPRPSPGYPRPYKVLGQWYQPMPDSKDFRQHGIASWYGEDFHGKKTSSGEIYNMYAMTAAHKTLPLGTYVQVSNLDNRQKVEVRINDRGPFVRDRIIDLSYSAAKEIGLIGPGTARVEVVALGSLVTTDGGSGRTYVQGDYYSGNFTFQVGAFLNRTNAERLRQELSRQYKNAHIATYNNGKDVFYRVRVGKTATLAEAIAYEANLIQKGFADVFVVAE
jgi:rare lipoprotein A